MEKAYRSKAGRGGYRNGGHSTLRAIKDRSNPSSASESSGTVFRNGSANGGSDDEATAYRNNHSTSDDGDEDFHFFKGGPSRFNNSHGPMRNEKFENYGNKHHNAVSSWNSGGGAGGAYRSSRTWISPDAQRMQEFLIIRNAMRRLFKYSDVAKWKYQDYIAHREAIVASQKATLAKEVKTKEQALEIKAPNLNSDAMATLNRFLPSEHNLDMRGNAGRVLGEKTIWCSDWLNGKEEVSPWPSFAEMKWEGDDRAKTGVGRFLPLPREMGAPGIPWNQLQVVEQYHIDQVARIPTMEDVYLPVDEIEDDIKYRLMTKDLEEAVDELLES